MIAGWSNDESAIIKDGLPLIIFGDHTRIFKFIDFPFAIGADGTKLIKPQSRFDARYFYYYLKKTEGISSGTYFEEGDILISKITPCFENWKQCIINKIPNGFGMATTEVTPIKEIPKISNKYFLFYYLLKTDIRSFIKSKMEGATGRQRVPVHVMKELLIPFPSLDEQNEINWPGFYDGIGQALAYLELPKFVINSNYKNCGGAFDFIYLVHARPDEKFEKYEKRILDLLPLGFIIALPDGSFQLIAVYLEELIKEEMNILIMENSS